MSILEYYCSYLLILLIFPNDISLLNFEHEGREMDESEIKNGEHVYKELKQGIVPSVLGEGDLEPEIRGLLAKYPNASTLLGNELTPSQTKVAPTVDWVSDENKYYTLLMTDPDAPSRADPKFGEVEHWLVVNIPSNKLDKGECLSEYIGPGPPNGTGLHRYIFLLFVQPNGKINFSQSYKGAEERVARRNFRTKDFVKKYNLGKVIAGNYFVAQWDESVGVKKLK